MEFSKLLLTHAQVAVSPGIGFGEHGEGYVRIALVENEQRIRQAARSVRKFLSSPPALIPNTQLRRERLARVGIAGLGTVGGGVVKILREHAGLLAKRCGRGIELAGVSALEMPLS